MRSNNQIRSSIFLNTNPALKVFVRLWYFNQAGGQEEIYQFSHEKVKKKKKSSNYRKECYGGHCLKFGSHQVYFLKGSETSKIREPRAKEISHGRLNFPNTGSSLILLIISEGCLGPRRNEFMFVQCRKPVCLLTSPASLHCSLGRL